MLPKSILLNRESSSCDSTSISECFMHFLTVVDAALGELEQNICEWERHFVLLTCFQSLVSVLQWRGVTRPWELRPTLCLKVCVFPWQTFFVLVTTCLVLHLQVLAKCWQLHCWYKNAMSANRVLSHQCVHLLLIQMNGLKSVDGGSTCACGSTPCRPSPLVWQLNSPHVN